ncbi:DNA/RNA nuclease SfsA [Alcanivorax sp. JB21]|uniref:DNA/RNA nuclease SfsA n=1 Tax=Alcanivorax limicola TaxID=2874102 RepID=UPI001CBE9170|nr:DNA/RNA nuclease SfsA [Alcanivorax limicola]MBZ2189439.1 DNA/RNA nuclease SfsA [Alcanivorax limicola]
MKFDPPLSRGRLLRRYKRFMADIIAEDGRMLTLHCPNTGSMKHCTPDNAPVLFSDSGNPKRKYRHTWEAVQVAHGHWAGINTGRTNALVAEAIAAQRIDGLTPEGLRREVTFGDSRFDIALGADAQAPDTFVEVKNVTLGGGEDEPDHGLIRFPDAVTLRGQKHLRTLMDVVASGRRAVLFFCVQHTGARQVAPADDIDPAYGHLLREAVSAGVEVMAWRTAISPEAFVLDAPVPLVL